MNHDYYVYFIRCSDASIYIGITNNLSRRLFEHEVGRNVSCYTYGRRPIQLLYYEQYQYIIDAIAREKHLKKWSRKKKLALCYNNYSTLSTFSRRKSLWTLEQKFKYEFRRKILCVMVRDAFSLRSNAPHHDT